MIEQLVDMPTMMWGTRACAAVTTFLGGGGGDGGNTSGLKFWQANNQAVDPLLHVLSLQAGNTLVAHVLQPKTEHALTGPDETRASDFRLLCASQL